MNIEHNFQDKTLMWLYSALYWIVAILLYFESVMCCFSSIVVFVSLFYKHFYNQNLSKSSSKQKNVIQIFIMFVEKCLFTLTMKESGKNKAIILRGKHTDARDVTPNIMICTNTYTVLCVEKMWCVILSLLFSSLYK